MDYENSRAHRPDDISSLSSYSDPSEPSALSAHPSTRSLPYQEVATAPDIPACPHRPVLLEQELTPNIDDPTRVRPALAQDPHQECSFRSPNPLVGAKNLRLQSSPRRWSASSSSTLVAACDVPSEHGANLMATGKYYYSQDPPPFSALSDATSAYPLSHSRSRPLIDLVTNEWQNSPKYADELFASHSPDDSFFYEIDESSLDRLRMLFARRIPRRVQRYLVIYLTLASIFWFGWKWFVRPSWEQRVALDASIDKGADQTFGSNMRPAFSDMIQVMELDSSLLPKAKTDKQRLIVVGDVHGCKDELVQLLDKISFRSSDDHLILAGDLIAKGPDSRGVVDLAQDLKASCVRGNHEDRMLLAWTDLHTRYTSLSGEKTDDDTVDISHGDHKDRALAKQFDKAQVRWLQQCPVILKVGQIPGMGEVSVVHAGLIPGVPFERQDPYQSMNMRSVDLVTKLPSEDRDGTPWEKLWNRYQSRVSHNNRGTVIYGHNSKRGLNIQKYSKGLDSGCVNGGKLTALVIEAGKKNEAVQRIVSVNCKEYKKTKNE